MKKVFNIISFMFLLWSPIELMAQIEPKTTMTVTISNKSFPERSDWGESVRIISLAFYVNDIQIGTVGSGLGSSDNSVLVNYEFPLTTAEIKTKIKITCIHHTWGVFGDHEYYVYKEYPLYTQNIDQSGDAGQRDFNAFSELPMVVSWSFSYKAQITPFQPEVKNSTEDRCYNSPFDLYLAQNNAGFYVRTDLHYEWQYGYESLVWKANNDFTGFIASVSNGISYLCINDFNVSCGKIMSTIEYTDYSFMNDYYDYYQDQTGSNRYYIASQMLQGMIDQNYSSFTEQEIAFLNSNFINVVLSQSYLQCPNNKSYEVQSWTTYKTSSEINGLVPCNPSDIFTATATKIKIIFRVRALSTDRQGPFCSPMPIFIKPPAPSFSYKTQPSCVNRNSGSIEISDLNGVVPGALYQCYIKNINSVAEEPIYKYGGFTVGDLAAGTYRIKIYYEDPDITGCAIIQDANIGNKTDLKYTYVCTDATCREKADGSVSVQLTTSEGQHNFRLNNTNITETTGRFSNLDNGSYTLEVTDLCYITPNLIPITISEPDPVKIDEISKLDPNCNSSPNGSILVQASGGKAGNTTFSYQLIKDGSAIPSQSGNQTWTGSGLAGGNYIVNVSAGGCAPTSSEVQTLSYVQPVDFSATTTPVDCFGMNSGSIAVSASGGINTYNYYVDGVQKNPPFGSLSSGNHLVKVESTACNDYKTASVSVGTASKIDITFTKVTNPSCYEGLDGKIEAAVSGGIGAYHYAWTSDVAYIPDNSGAINSLMAGNYTLSITDSKNCSVSRSTALSDPPELFVQNAVSSDAACFGGKGSISITASGGTGVYTYSCTDVLGTFFDNPASVPPGEYYAQVKDKNGCMAEYSDMVMVTGPDSHLELSWDSPSFNGFNVSCQGEATGLINVEALGGNGYSGDGSEYDGYWYSLSGSPFQPADSFLGLHAGSHNIRVKDARGCIVEESVSLTEPASLTLNLVSTSPVRCFGESTGGIIVSASGGIENTYKFYLDGAEMLTPGIFSNLQADTYEVEVSDLNGCRKTIFPSVESLYPPIGIITTTKDVRCFGEGNGEISTAVSGGAGGFAYEWEKKEGAGWLVLEGSAANRTNVLPGIYRVKVTDAESCFRYADAEIKEPSPLQVTGASSSDIVCLGEKGSITINATGGVAGYTYYCSAENGDIFESPAPAMALPAGTYTTRIKDINGCIAVNPAALQVTQPTDALDFTTGISSYNGYSVSCNGKSDGLITLAASGGNGAGYSGYRYSIGNNPDQADNSFRDLASGSYSVKVSDGRGCSVQKSILLTEPDPVSINLMSVSKVKCFGTSTGEIRVVTSGGVPEYAYRLNGATAASSGFFKDLSAGTYSIEVMDLNGCTSGLSPIVEHKNPPITSNLTPVSVRCYGESNGEITTELAGGSGGFASAWEKKTGTGWEPYNASGINIANLPAGFYRLKTIDSDNCADTDSVEVRQPGQLRISNVRIRDAICFGDPGSFAIEAAGGNGNYLFQYSPNNNKIIYFNYAPSDPLPAGFYGLKVTDSKGCEYEDPGMYHITSPSVPLAFNPVLSEYGKFNVSCHGNDDGSVSVQASGGNEFGYTGYTYRLSGRQVQNESVFREMEAGAYDITVTDGRGCILTKAVTMTQPESAIKLAASALKRPLCVYDSNGAVTLSAAGGSLPYQFSMNDGDYTASTEFTGLPVNDYRFRVRDRNGCSETFDTTLVNIISEMTISGDVSDVRCFGGNTGSINVHVIGGAAPFAYSWTGTASSASAASNLLKGSYSVLITDLAGCHSEKAFSVSQPEKPLSLAASSLPACVGLKNGTIEAVATGGTAPYRFAVDSDKEFPLPSSFNVYSGNHKVYVSDRNDCLAETGVYVNVRNTMPDINFMLATSRYELDTLVVIDVSVPPPDEVTWEFSDGAAVIATSHNMAKVKYNSAGLYPVKMTGLFGTCAYTIEKLLNIAPFDPSVIGDGKNREGIKSLRITPNPNDGAFELAIELYTRQQVTVRIFDLSSRLVYNETYPADMSFVRELSLPETVMPGTYVLRATCENDARSAVFVISK